MKPGHNDVESVSDGDEGEVAALPASAASVDLPLRLGETLTGATPIWWRASHLRTGCWISACCAWPPPFPRQGSIASGSLTCCRLQAALNALHML